MRDFCRTAGTDFFGGLDQRADLGRRVVRGDVIVAERDLAVLEADAGDPQAMSIGVLQVVHAQGSDKIIDSKRICESTGTGDFKEAKAVVARFVQEAREARLLGAQRARSFREAAIKSLEENTHKRSLECDARALAALDSFIGELQLRRGASGHATTLRARSPARMTALGVFTWG